MLIRIRRVGLCGTDHHIYAGQHPFLEYPRVMGHELAGEVAESDERSAFRPGQLVTVNPYLACGTCIACRRGKPNCCQSIRVLGVHMDGGMCEYLSVPESAVIDASRLSVDQAAMVEFLAIGAHAVRRAGAAGTDRALIVGAGPIGLAVALFARLNGADVTLMDVSGARLAHARARFGFGNCVIASPDSSKELTEITRGDMFDCVFDATGNVAAMCNGLAHVAHGGRYTLVSVVKENITFPDPEFHKRETTLFASRNAVTEDFAAAIQFLASGLVPTDALNTHSIAALELPQHMPRLVAERDRMLKAIVHF